ncbi:sensor histidine kinase [Spirosoma areae]
MHLNRVAAQPVSAKFEHLSVKNGLSNNSVSCILQDREGFLWFGTSDGLNKYDGYTFQVFQPDPARPARSFRNNRVSGLCEDRQNRLWAVTEGGGLHEVNKQTGGVTPHPIHAEHENWWNNQLSVYEDHQGILWLSSYGGLVRYDPAKHHFTLYPSPRREVPVKCVFEDRQNRLWVATSQGLYQFDRQHGRFTLLPYQTATTPQPWFGSFYLDDHDVLWLGVVGRGILQLNLRSQPFQLVPYQSKHSINKFMYLNTLHRDTQGFVWMGTTEGLQRIEPTTNQVSTYLPDPASLHSLSSAHVQAVYHDRTGTLWIGTDNGIDKQAINTKPFTTYQLKRSVGNANLIENKVFTLSADDQNRVWFSNQDNLQRLDVQQNRIREIPAVLFGTTPGHKNFIHALLPDGPTGLWIGTWDGLYRLDQTTNRSVKFTTEIPVQFVSKDALGTLWLAGEGGLASFNPRTNQFIYYKYNLADTAALSEKYIDAMLVSRAGDVWASVRGKGISRLNPRTGRFTRYVAGTQPGRLNNNEIGTFYEDKSGTIWVGTTRGGLNCFNSKTGLFSHITTQQGLPSNWIIGITGDDHGYLWVSTNKGLCRFDPRTNVARPYDSHDGLPSNDFMVNAVSRNRRSLFFGTLNGLVRFNPDSIQDDTNPFPVYITNFKVHNKSRSLPEPITTLPYNQNFLSFEFVALTYSLPERNRYAYQLAGIDNDWVQNGSRRFANYTNLPPGEYTFRVKASTSDRIWHNLNKPVSIRILSPWWQTWPAYILYVLLSLGSLWGFIAYRSRQLRAANRRLEEIVTNRTAEVRRQNDQITHQRDSLEKTLAALKATQNQLVQKEKLASLGELMAGIAHEIQNPLNFVNNFAEVTVELVDELQQSVVAGDTEQVTALTENLSENLQRIVRNGQRASAIVRSMLEHAHTDTAPRQPTNLNALADECLRVAYQGQQARENGFQAKLITKFDPNLGLVESAPQDIGRVLLNVFNNAFYAVSEKKRQQPAGFEPSVTVETQRLDDHLELIVRDNGTGIPEGIRDKIFNPFFTTKPAGQGTGLGLALSYDIVTKGHGGQLRVQSQEGQFTEFSLHLPLTNA